MTFTDELIVGKNNSSFFLFNLNHQKSFKFESSIIDSIAHLNEVKKLNKKKLKGGLFNFFMPCLIFCKNRN